MTAIIYAADKQITPQHRILQPTKRDGDTTFPVAGPHIFVRMELSDRDIQDALLAADPMPGETVLNTFELVGMESISVT